MSIHTKLSDLDLIRCILSMPKCKRKKDDNFALEYRLQQVLKVPIEPAAKVICLTKACFGKTIVEAGRPVDQMYIILCGEVIVSIPNPKI